MGKITHSRRESDLNLIDREDLMKVTARLSEEIEMIPGDAPHAKVRKSAGAKLLAACGKNTVAKIAAAASELTDEEAPYAKELFQRVVDIMIKPISGVDPASAAAVERHRNSKRRAIPALLAAVRERAHSSLR